MADLHETCTNVGLDSSRYKPIAHATAEGRVAVYVGAAYAHLTRGQAINLRDQITRALGDLEVSADRAAGHHATAPSFAAQMQAFRAQSAVPPTTDQEAIALAAIAQEHQP